MTEGIALKGTGIMTIPIFLPIFTTLNVMAVKVRIKRKILNWSNEINIEDMGVFRLF